MPGDRWLSKERKQSKMPLELGFGITELLETA